MTSIDPSLESARPDWGIEPPPAGVQGLVLAIAIPVVVVAVLITLVSNLVVGGLTLMGLATAAVVVVTMRERSILRSAGAKPLGGDDGQRLVNLVEGLAGANRLPRPSVCVIEQGGPNALVVWAGGPHMAVTRSMLDGYTRTDMEAVVAHCLVRLGSGEARRTTFRCALGLGGNPGSIAAVDGNAVALTRYPPGLISAITKAEPPAAGSFSALWLVGDGSSHPPMADRVAWLADL